MLPPAAPSRGSPGAEQHTWQGALQGPTPPQPPPRGPPWLGEGRRSHGLKNVGLSWSWVWVPRCNWLESEGTDGAWAESPSPISSPLGKIPQEAARGPLGVWVLFPGTLLEGSWVWFPALPLSLPSLLLPQAFDPQPYCCPAGTWGKALPDPPEVQRSCPGDPCPPGSATPDPEPRGVTLGGVGDSDTPSHRSKGRIQTGPCPPPLRGTGWAGLAGEQAAALGHPRAY